MGPRDFGCVDVKHSAELGDQNAVIVDVDVNDRAVVTLFNGKACALWGLSARISVPVNVDDLSCVIHLDRHLSTNGDIPEHTALGLEVIRPRPF